MLCCVKELILEFIREAFHGANEGQEVLGESTDFGGPDTLIVDTAGIGRYIADVIPGAEGIGLTLAGKITVLRV